MKYFSLLRRHWERVRVGFLILVFLGRCNYKYVGTFWEHLLSDTLFPYFQKNLLLKLAQNGPFIIGSLNTVQRICGKELCQCMKGGKKHLAMFFTWKEKNKTKTIYVPVSKYNAAHLYNENFKKLKKIICQISEIQKKLLKS